jgi:branched-chain amino acid transport system ATP-binding protein
MLRIDELRVNYGRVPALHGISLHVDEGEAVTLVGPNGAGKTATLSAISLPSSRGTILFRRVARRCDPEILRRGLTHSRGRHIFGTLGVARISATARDQHGGRRSKECLRALPSAGSYYDRTAGTLSGERQRDRTHCSRARGSPTGLARARARRDRIVPTRSRICAGSVTILLVEQNAARWSE